MKNIIDLIRRIIKLIRVEWATVMTAGLVFVVGAALFFFSAWISKILLLFFLGYVEYQAIHTLVNDWRQTK